MYSTKHKISTWKLLLALIISGIAASTMAQDVNISVSDMAAISGETILVPLRISPIDETDAVISGTFKFSTNESIFEIVGFDKAGTMLENTSNVFYNVGTNTLAFAGTDTLVGSGTLFNLRVKAKDNASYFQYTDVSFTEASLNEGEPTVNATGARWTIKGIQINPRHSNIFVLEGDSLQFNLTGNIVDPVTWSVTDTTIGTIDSNGLFAAKTFGLVQVKAVDGQGLRDSTAFFRVQPATLTELSVTIPDTSIRQTKDIALPIYISDVTGLEVLSADLQVNYNQNYLTLNGVTSVGTMTESWGEPTINTETGSVKIASAGTDTLQGFGTLYYLNFTVKDINTGRFPINFAYANLNEDLSIDLNNGNFTVLAKPTIDLNLPDTAISIGQSIDFDVTGGDGTGPYTWQVDDETVASIDINTGLLTAASRGDVLVNAVDNEGFLSSPINIRVNDFDAYLDSSTAIFPDTIEVALRTGDLSPFNVLSYQAEVEYDTTKLEFLGLKTEGTQSKNASAEATVDASLKIASAGTSFLGGTDPIVNLKFAQKDAIEHLDELILELKYLTFDEPGPDVPTTSPLPGILDMIKIDPPEAPELVYPVDLAVNQDTSIVFDWNSSDRAEDYQFQLSTTADFSVVVTDSTLSGTELSVSGLMYLTDYFWRVKASNIGGESAWSDTLAFTTIIEKPEKPNPLLPDDGVIKTDTLVAFSWNVSDRADSYLFQLSKTNDFSNIDFEITTTDTALSQGGLAFLTDYFWRVKATNVGGESEFSDVQSFQTKAIPAGIPMLISPADQTVDTDTSLTLMWASADGAVSYEYQLATGAGFSSVIGGTNTGSDTSATIADLSYLTEYFWRVRTIGAQDTSAYSSPFSFTTKIESPEIPVLMEPLNGADRQPTDLTLMWKTADRATEYSIQVATDADFNNLVADETTSDTSYAVTNLEFLTDYHWRVLATNSTGSSDYSAVSSFQTKAIPAGIPMLISPVDLTTDTDTSLILMWASAEGAVSYEYQVATDAGFSSLVGGINTGSDTSATIADLSYLTEYFWRVRAIGAQDTSAYSSPFSFTTKIALPNAPILISPADGVTEQALSLDLIWSKAARAAEYHVEISETNDFSVLVYDQTTTDTTVLATGLKNLTDYYWRVKSANTTGESGYSEVRTFQTKAVDASVPVLINPVSGSTDVDTSLTLTWSSAEGAVNYEYQVSSSSDFSRLVATSIINDTTSLISGLDYLTQYFWRVRAVGAQNTSDWSGVFDFTTKIAIPSAPELIDPADGEDRVPTDLVLAWKTADRASGYTIELSTDTGFSTLIVQDATTDTMYSVSGLDFLTDYFWRVKSTNSTGESVFSTVSSFQTKADDASIPELLSPADLSMDVDTSVTLTWASAPAAVGYQYEVSTTADFGSLFASGEDTDTTALINGMNYSTQYFWRVRSLGVQDTSSYASAFSFTTKIAPPASPTLVSPADGALAQPLSIDLVWNASARASEYQVVVSKSPDFSSTLSDQTVSDTTALIIGLSNLTDYFWRVKSINTTGESAYSEIRTFQTKAVDASVPVLINPVSGSTDVDTSLTLTWSSAEGALNYEYQVSEAVDFASLIHTASGPDTTALISGLSFSTQYYWRARAIGAQDTSDWSSIFDFTTITEKPEVPALVSPIDDFTDADTTLSLVWNSSERAAEYQVELSKSDSFTEILIASVVSDTSLVVSNLDFSSTYFWKVKALNVGGESEFSQTRSFQTKVAPTGLPFPLLPAKSENGVDTMPTFLWSQAENALSYRFQLSSDVDFSSVLDDQKGLVDTTTSSSGLSFGTEYFWRVKAFGVNDSTEWSLVFNFTTRFDELAAPTLLSPAKNAIDLEDSVSFEWTSVTEADSYDFELNSDTTQTALVNINQADTIYTHTSLAFDSTYYWRVKANDGITGRTSVWTPWFAFTVKSQPDADPTVVNPLGAITLFEDFADTTIADLSTVFDDPGDVLSFLITQTSDLVNTSIDGSNLIFTSVQDTSGSAEIIVEASDAAGNTVSDTLSVSVTPVNDLTYVVELPDTLTFKVGEVFNFTIDTAFADVEDELGELSFSVSVNPTDILLGFDPNTYSITLNSPSYVGFGEIRLTVEDSEGGQLEVVLVIEVEMATSNALMADIPSNFELQQNYPNPFNPSSNIRFGLPESGEVRLDVYNMLGQRVATLVNQKMQAGWHSVTFDASGLSSGTYIYRITSGDFVQTKKMMLIK